MTDKRYLIIAGFGSTFLENYRLGTDPIFKAVQEKIAEDERYAGIELIEVITSNIVRKRLKDRGIEIMSIKECLKYCEENSPEAEIYIQPLHVIPGIEYGKLKRDNVHLGEVLMHSDRDIEDFARRVDFGVPDDEGLILVGHGTRHAADEVYDKLAKAYQRLGKKVYLTTVEGGERDLLPLLDKNTKYSIRPLMFVAGDHAHNDIGGDDEDSLLNIYQKAGFEVEAVLKGLGELEDVRDIYLDKIDKLLFG